MSITTPRAPAEVFSYLARFSNAADWDPGVAGAEDISPGPPRVGSAYRLIVRFLGGKFPLDYRIAELASPGRVVLEAENAFIRSSDAITVAPAAGGGAQVTYAATLTLKGAAVLATPVVGLAFLRTAKRAIAGLRTALR